MVILAHMRTLSVVGDQYGGESECRERRLGGYVENCVE